MNLPVRFLLLICHFLCPLLFFTDLTRNPYFTQIVLLNVGLMAAAAAYFWGQSGSGEWRLPRTPLDAPLACWLGLCCWTWIWAYFHHAPFFRDAMRAEGLRVFSFTVVNTILPFYLAAACARNCPAQPDISLFPWALATVAWGGLWTLFPELRSSGGPVLSVWTHLWDLYGGILWAAGLLIYAGLLRDGSVHRFWHLALAVGFLASVYGVFQYFNHELVWPKVLNPYGGRSVSTFGNPNFMSSYLVMLLPVAAAYYLKAGGRAARIAYAAVFLALEGCLLGSLTRSSWVGALAGLILLSASRDLRARLREDLESHGLVAAIAAALILFWPQSTVSGFTPSVFGRVKELASAFDVKATQPYSPLYQRVLIWSSAWLMGKENPLWGKGFGLFELFYPFYQGHVLNTFELFRNMRTHANNAHNEILETFSQTGLLGVGVLLWMWTTFFVTAVRWLRAREGRGKEDRTVWMVAGLAGVGGMLVDNLLNVSLHFAVPAFLFWWQAGVVMGVAGPAEAEWRILRFPGRKAAMGAALAASVLCAAGGRWWADQWNREVHYFLGFKLLRGEHLGKAIEELEVAYHWHGREVNTNYELANAYARTQAYPKAVWAYGEALKSNAGYDEIYFNMATVLAQRLGRPDEALKYYLTSYFINPLSPDLYSGLSAFYLRDIPRYRDDAVALLERAAHFFPENAGFLLNLGYLYRQERRYAAAEDVLSRALYLDPDMKLAQQYLSEMSRESGRPPAPVMGQLAAIGELEGRIARKDFSSATLELARKVARWFPRGAKARFYVGNLEMLNGHPEAALEALEPLSSIDPRNAVLQRNLGEIYLRLGRTPDAVRAFTTSLQSDPGNEYVRQRLAQLGYGERGR